MFIVTGLIAFAGNTPVPAAQTVSPAPAAEPTAAPSPVQVESCHVQYGDQSLFIRDVGTFSTGMEITHKFKSFEGDLQLSPLLQGQKPVTCDVAWTHFTNGIIWPASAQQPTAVPSPASTRAASGRPKPADYDFGSSQ